MPKVTLEHVKSIYEESLHLREKFSIYNQDDSEIIKKESAHRALIEELSKHKAFLHEIKQFFKHEDKKVREQAYLIALETKDRELVKKVIESHFKFIKKRDGSACSLPLSLLSINAFDIFMEEFISIRKEYGDEYFSLVPILQFMASNQYDKYLDFFMKLDFFTVDEQDRILYYLGHLEKFSSVIRKEYHNKHSFFEVSFFEDSTYFKTAIPLLLAKEEEIGLNLLRQKQYIGHEYALRPFLHYFGDKKDVRLISNFFISQECIEEPELLAKRIKSLAGGGGNYAYVDTFFELIERNIDVLVTLAISEQFVFYAKLKEEDKEYDEYLEMSDALNSAAYLTDTEIKEELSEEEQKLIEPQYIKDFWQKIFEKNRDIIDVNKRISLMEEDKLYSLNTLLDNVLYDSRIKNMNEPLPAELKYLIIYTGQYLPVDEAGYFTKRKEHIVQWREYIKKNKVNLEDGRWWRYGRYVDEDIRV